MNTAVAAEPKPFEKVHRALVELEPAQAPMRCALGLPERDPAILERVARRYRPPAWARGCISGHDALFLYDLIRATRPRRSIEVGVAAGGSTSLLLLALADAGIPLIDDRGQHALHSFELHPRCYFDRDRSVGSAVAEMVPELAHAAKLHVPGTAAAAARLFTENPVDFALIDANHSHPWPTADLLTLLPALKPGAWVALHDIALPDIARDHERRTGERVSWGERGAQILFDHWPFEKIRGGGDDTRIGGRNIGAIRIPTDHQVTAEDLRAAIETPWESQPDEPSRRVLALQISTPTQPTPAAAPALESPSAQAASKTPCPPRTTSTIALIAPHTVSGVSAAMSRLTTLGPNHHPWRLLAVGSAIGDTSSIMGSDTPGFATLSWDPSATPIQQVRLVRDRLRELNASVVSPNFLLQGFIAAALDHHRGRRAAAIWHGSELSADDLYERAAPLTDSWRAVSPAINDRLQQFCPASPAPPVLPSGIQIPDDIAPLPCTQSESQPLRLLYAAWLDERAKRVMDLPILADALHARGIAFKLDIAGRGPAAKKLAAALATHIVAGRVAMLGTVPLDRMPTLHREHDLVLLVSAMEGTPVVVMEAMAHGRPVAITRGCGGALRAVRDGDNGLIVDVGDMDGLAARIAALASRPHSLSNMGRRAHAAAREHFDIRAIASGYDSLIDDAIAAAPGPDHNNPGAIAATWGHILAALELLGPASPPELAGLAVEWLSDLNASHIHVHLTDDAATLMEPITRFGPALITAAAADRPEAPAFFAGWPVSHVSRLKPGTLLLTSDPERLNGLVPSGVCLLPLRLPNRPTRAARLVLDAVATLRTNHHNRIALYGAGKHTRKIAPWLAGIPEIIAIIDDRAGKPDGPGPRLWGLPIAAPSQLAELGIDAIIVSSDEHERAMLPRARAWAGDRPVIPLYEALEAAAGACSPSRP